MDGRECSPSRRAGSGKEKEDRSDEESINSAVEQKALTGPVVAVVLEAGPALPQRFAKQFFPLIFGKKLAEADILKRRL